MAAAPTEWLQAFVLADRFFTPCGKCSSSHSSRDASLNFWDVAAQQELCSVCLLNNPARDSVIQVRGGKAPGPRARPVYPIKGSHTGHQAHVARMRAPITPQCNPILVPAIHWPPVLHAAQVRRSSYHDVVKVGDVARLADISGIQSYVINGSKVLFLRRRPQPRPPKGAVGASQCTVCARHLQDVSHYCSLQCKLDSGAPAPLHSAAPSYPAAKAAAGCSSAGGSKDSSPDTPQHHIMLKALLDSGSDSDTA